jgi:DNA-binding NtrC family response regulator
MAARRILLVDDDAQLVTLLERYLNRLGFDVVPCWDARAALDCFLADGAQFDLVVADMTMPGLSGEELLRAVLQEDAGIRAILCSGYATAGATLENEFGDRVQFLQKPFASRMLTDVIEKLLGSGK